MKAKKRKVTKGKVVARGSSAEAAGALGMGYGARQHQDVVPHHGQGPSGTATVQIGSRRAPPKPAVGAGKGFKGI